jgi:hypothetical protein
MGGKSSGDKKASLMGDLPPLPTRHTAAQMGIKPEDIEMTDVDGSEELADAVDLDSVPFTRPLAPDYYPTDVWDDMEDYERDLPPSQYFRLLRRQLHWAEQEGRELQGELEEARSTSEDAKGYVIQRGAGDEKSADENRRLAWQRNEQLLDGVLRAETSHTYEMFTGEKPDPAERNPWAMLRMVHETVSAMYPDDH